MNTEKKNKQPTALTQKIETPQKIFIGVSWPYANGNIHIGHLAGQYAVCDVFARYHRLKGNEVLMVSGSDSHGAPVIFAAEEQGTTPENLAEKAHKQIVETYKKLGFIYENYTTTRTKNHAKVAQNIFLVLNELGFLTVKKTKQYYDPKAKRFLPDRYVRGTCPHCKATNARGDECPECGNMLDPEDLIDPYSTLSDAKPELRETEHYYLDLSKVQGDLSEWLKNKSYWRKWVREFTLGWLRGGLQPRCVTRDFNFGVPVPVEGWEGKVLYVWIEAVVGYLSAAIEWAEKIGTPSAWEDFWKDPSCKHYYFIAGGNVPFHTIIWPAELIGYNGKYSSDTLWKKYKLPGETKRKPLDLPYDVPANNILTYRGKKMSKGDKVGVTLDTLLTDYEPDVIRYFFVRYAPENQDREFIWKDFIDANNNELVANVGNFINRVLSFTASRFGGTVPEGNLDAEVHEKITRAFANVSSHLEKTEFVKATEALLNLGHFANKYFNDQKPWETVKTDPTSSANTLYNSIQLVQALQILFKPFLPFSAEKLRIQLNLEGTTLEGYDPQLIPAGHTLGTPEILFPKLEYSEALEKEDTPTTEEHVIAADTTYDFRHIDEHVVIGKITEVAKDNGRRITIDIGGKSPVILVCKDTTLEQGRIVPVALPGTKIRSTTGTRRKIKAGKVGGIQSNGMLCSAYELEIGEEKKRILQLPKEFGTYLGEPLATVRSDTLV